MTKDDKKQYILPHGPEPFALAVPGALGGADGIGRIPRQGLDEVQPVFIHSHVYVAAPYQFGLRDKYIVISINY